MPFASSATLVDHTAASNLWSTVPFGQKPANGFAYLNNTWGKGTRVNGTDFVSKMTCRPARFPQGMLFEWNYPKATDSGTFINSYPEVILGGGNYGDNSFTTEGPWRNVKAKNIAQLLMTYDVTLNGNPAMFNVLSDMYFTAAANSTDGSTVLELSFFPHNPDPNNKSNTTTFVSAGKCAIYLAGTQMQVTPVTAGNAPRDLLAATVDMREIVQYLIAQGYLTGEEYIRGAEFGAEIFNAGAAPVSTGVGQAVGSLRINRLAYDWDGSHYE